MSATYPLLQGKEKGIQDKQCNMPDIYRILPFHRFASGERPITSLILHLLVEKKVSGVKKL